jgi:hypothetical protein
MTWKRALALASAALVVATSTLVGAVSAPALASTTVTVPFDANSGDASGKSCGFTTGSIYFSPSPPRDPAWPISGDWDLDVNGVVVDRPEAVCGPPTTPPPVGTDDPAADDGRITVATFTATPARPGLTETVSYEVDNDSRQFSFQFGMPQIELVSIQVCRIPLSGSGKGSYCGQPTLITAPPGRP